MSRGRPVRKYWSDDRDQQVIAFIRSARIDNYCNDSYRAIFEAFDWLHPKRDKPSVQALIKRVISETASIPPIRSESVSLVPGEQASDLAVMPSTSSGLAEPQLTPATTSAASQPAAVRRRGRFLIYEPIPEFYRVTRSRCTGSPTAHLWLP